MVYKQLQTQRASLCAVDKEITGILPGLTKCAWINFPNPQECVHAFQNPLWLSCSSCSSGFLFKFLVEFCLPHLLHQTALMVVFLITCHRLLLFLLCPRSQAFSQNSQSCDAQETASPALEVLGVWRRNGVDPHISAPHTPMCLLQFSHLSWRNAFQLVIYVWLFSRVQNCLQ